MRTYWTPENDEESCDSVTSADLDDVFGVEAGGFCNFTNSIVIIYLQLWLNEKPGLANFVSQLPEAIQIDTVVNCSSAVAVKPPTESKMGKRPYLLAESINNLAKARKINDGRTEMHSSITKFMKVKPGRVQSWLRWRKFS
jgi:hypothetical protein